MCIENIAKVHFIILEKPMLTTKNSGAARTIAIRATNQSAALHAKRHAEAATASCNNRECPSGGNIDRCVSTAKPQ
jgi:hypothetical protein